MSKTGVAVGFNINHCSLENFALTDLSQPKMPRIRYVVRNIYDLATNFAAIRSALAVPSIISTLDPEKKADTTLSIILTALTAGLAFLALPAVGAAVPAATTLVGSILTTSLQQAPSVAQAIWPQGDENSQIVQIGDLQAELADLNSQIAKMLNAGLSSIMTDVNAFAKFASSTEFSGQEIPSLPTETEGLDLAFKTYLVTRAMSANEWLAYWGPPDNTDDGSWSNSTASSNAKKFVCNLKSNGICDTIDSRGVPRLCQPEDWSEYTSNTSHRAYYPTHAANEPTSAAVANAIADKGWGSLEMVFDGGYNCSVNHPDGATTAVKVSGETGRLDFSCLSQLRVQDGCEKRGERGWQLGCDKFFEKSGVCRGLLDLVKKPATQ
ncbi:MAG: hypothetical protein Q9200_000555 [Gallowayella weberi]